MRTSTDDFAKTKRVLRHELIHGDITDKVLGAFFEVYRILGPGFLESTYANALELEFQARGIAYLREYPLTVYYKGASAGSYRADFLVEARVIVEVKASRHVGVDDQEQLTHYLTATRTKVGLLLHFGSSPKFYRSVNFAGD